MADDVQNSQPSPPYGPSPNALSAVNWREVFPFLHLFRTFRIAVHPSKLILGLLALLILYAAGRALDAFWPVAHLANYSEVSDYETFDSGHSAPAGGFHEVIEQSRLKSQAEVANRLQAIGVAVDAQKPTDVVFAKSGALQDKIVDERDHALATADKTLETDVTAAKAVSDASVREEMIRTAQRTYSAAVETAMALAHSSSADLRTLLPRGIFDAFFNYESAQLERVVYGVRSNNWTGGLPSPVAEARTPSTAVQSHFHFSGREPTATIDLQPASPDGVIVAIQHFVITGPSWLLRYHSVYFAIYFVVFLLVWSIFGGAISRIAAVHAARDEKISVRQALRFSSNKVFSYIFAPLIPLGIAILIGLLVATGGLLFYVPWLGPILGGGLLIVGLLGGVLITLILIGTVGGMNLMYPTIAAEGSDSFDAISRSFSYVYARPWRMIFYTAVSIVYGALTYIFVKLFVFLVLSITHYFVGLWLIASPGRWFPEMWPAPDALSLPYTIDFAGLKFTEKAAAFLICFWTYLLIGLLGAFIISFYFSASTIIYYLMRREVDATDISDVYVEETDDDLTEPGPATTTDSGSSPTDPPGGSEATSPAT